MLPGNRFPVLRYASVACALALAAVAVTSPAAAQTVYNSIPSPLPPNVASEGPEAYAFRELGDGFTLTGTGRLGVITVIMSSWACQAGQWNFANCVTTPGATFSQTITFNVYSVTGGPGTWAPGPLLATLTQMFNMPYRPTNDPVDCAGSADGVNAWYDAALGTCADGIAFPISMNFGSLNVTVPLQIIVTVAYNTSTAGPNPIGTGTACFASSAGCPYDSLNISTDTTDGTFNFIGAPLDPNSIFVNYISPANSCSGAAPTNVLALDAGCWAGYHPEIQVNLASILTTMLMDDPVQIHYFANPNVGDSYINITNDGANGDELLGPGAGSAGYICANVYAFDATDEQEVACCSCPVSPNGIVSLTLSSIMSKTLTGFTPTSSIVKLVATMPSAGFGSGACTNSAESLFTTSSTLADGMVAWATTISQAIASGGWASVQTLFVPVSPGVGPSTQNLDLASIAVRCAGIIGNGSASGVCPGCVAGSLGAQKM